MPLIKSYRLNINSDILKALTLSIFLEVFLVFTFVIIKKSSIIFIPGVLPQIILYSIIFSFLLSLILIALRNFSKNFYINSIIFSAVFILLDYPYYILIDPKTIFSISVFHIIFIAFFSILTVFIFFKTRFNGMAAFVFICIFEIFSFLSISIDISKYFYLIWEMVSISLVMFMADIIIRNSLEFNRTFKSRKINLLKEIKKSKFFIAVFLIVIIITILFAPGVSHSYYLLADPTSSMYPVIKPDSVLVVNHINPVDVKIGDIIVFNAPWKNGESYAHQVINICYIHGKEYFRTKGVNNPSKDPLPVPTYDVKGLVAYSIPYAGYIIIYSKVIISVVFFAFSAMLLLPKKRRHSGYVYR